MANATIFANTAVQECTAKILRMNNSPIPIPMQSLPKKFFLPTISPLFVSTSGYVNWSRKRNQVDVRRRRCFSCVVPYCGEALDIRKHKCGPGHGLNEDMGAYVRTDIWDTVLNSMG